MLEHLSKILSVQSRPTLSRNGRPSNEVSIEIETVLGSTGVVTIPEREYEVMDDNDLRDFLEKAAARLDRPHMLLAG